MEHSYFKDRISAFHDQELKHEEAQMMAEHLETCEECRRLLEELKKFDRMVEKHSGLADDEYWEESARKIEAAITPSVSETEIIPVKSKWSGMGWKLAAVAASVTVLAFIGLHEGDISKSLKGPAQAEAPQVMEITTVPVDSMTGTEGYMEADAQQSAGDAEPTPAKKEAPSVPAADEVQREIVRADKIQPEEEVYNEVAVEPLEQRVEKDYPVRGIEPETLKLGSVEEKVKELGADSEFPATQLVQSVPIEVRKERSSETVHDTTGAVEQFEYEIAEEAPVPLARRVYRDEAQIEDEDELERLRQTRDSLEDVVSAGKTKASAGKIRSTATSVVPTEIAPTFKGVDSVDKDELKEAVDSVSKELERSDPVLKLLETHFEIASLTDDRREYERSLDFIRSYLDKDNSLYKLQAAWYLQRLEEAD